MSIPRIGQDYEGDRPTGEWRVEGIDRTFGSEEEARRIALSLGGYSSTSSSRSVWRLTGLEIAVLAGLVACVFLYDAFSTDGKQQQENKPRPAPVVVQPTYYAASSGRPIRTGSSIADGRSDCHEIAPGQVHCPPKEWR